MAGALAGIRAAFALLSRFPVGRAPLAPPSSAAPWLWLPGATIGLLAAGVAAAFDAPWTAAAAALVVAALASGAMHLEAVADLFDGLAAMHADPARYDEARRDPAIGAIGAAALGMAIVAQFAALVDWAASGAPVSALIAAGAWSRWWGAAWPLLLGARGGGMAAALAAGASRRALVAAGGGLLLVTAAIAPMQALVAVGAGLGWAAFVHHRLGAVDGDACGAGIVGVEIAVLWAA